MRGQPMAAARRDSRTAGSPWRFAPDPIEPTRGERPVSPMARFEGYDGSPEILEGNDGREWPATWSSARIKVAAAGVLALALAAIGGFYLGMLRDPSRAKVADDVVVAVPGGRPSGAGFAAGSVWVTTWDGFVVRVDPETRRVVARVAVGEAPLAAQEGFGVWVTNSADGTVTQLNPADNSFRRTIPVGPLPYQLAAAGGGMWVATQNAAVKIDPGSDRVALRAPYPHARDAETPNTAGVGFAADERAVWVSAAVGTVLRLDPITDAWSPPFGSCPTRTHRPGLWQSPATTSGCRTGLWTAPRDPGPANPSWAEPWAWWTSTYRPTMSFIGSPAGLPGERDAAQPGQPVHGRRRLSEPYERPDPRGLALQGVTSVRPVGGNSFDVVAADEPCGFRAGTNTPCTCYLRLPGRPADSTHQPPCV